ncbi:MAG: Asp-tRNA(Asn)/Glu-tRNA(Gln) amidotransferase subunit GatC [Clostridia bacterium]|nr:Asp-tRNA(Asn)/Glu-tRNA(Gln) amidotransferase subunit GatC [Clostridia bacterium]
MISKKDVLHIAKLSKLEFSDEEIEKFTTEMSTIVEYVNTLQNVDTSDVNDELSVLPLNDLRADQVKPSLSQEDAIKNAPKKRSGGFSVPQVVE